MVSSPFCKPIVQQLNSLCDKDLMSQMLSDRLASLTEDARSAPFQTYL